MSSRHHSALKNLRHLLHRYGSIYRSLIDSLDNARPLRIGWYYDPNFFSGLIDDIHVYNRALSTAEIQTSFQVSPDFSFQLLAKIPKGATQVITTISWQGSGSITATITTPSKTYTEDMIPVYQKTTYSQSSSTQNMLNIKRSSISVSPLSSDQSWSITLTFDIAVDYKTTVEVEKTGS